MSITSDIRTQGGGKQPRYLQPTKSSRNKTNRPIRESKVTSEKSFNIIRASTTFRIPNRKIIAGKETPHRSSSILKTPTSKTNLNVKASTRTVRFKEPQSQTTSVQKPLHVKAKTRKNIQEVANKVISNQVKLRQRPPATLSQEKPITQQKESRSNNTLEKKKPCTKIVTHTQSKKRPVTMHISSLSPTKQKLTLAQDIEQTFKNVHRAATSHVS